MKSPWKVTYQWIGDCKMYAAYRLRNVNEVDHSGNREYAGDYTEDRDKAQELADRLNAQEGR